MYPEKAKNPDMVCFAWKRIVQFGVEGMGQKKRKRRVCWRAQCKCRDSKVACSSAVQGDGLTFCFLFRSAAVAGVAVQVGAVHAPDSKLACEAAGKGLWEVEALPGEHARR